MIAGEFLPAYEKKLGQMLAHSSIRVLGHRNDVPELMRQSDVLVLPSIEEGFGLVVAEAMASGCVPLASDACTEICQHMETGLVHRVADVETLAGQITLLHNDRALLEGLRGECLRRAPGLTWTAAGVRLLDVYHEVLAAKAMRRPTGA
jgi:glycosyltransferase involved in cell wall biosynthesis